MMLYNEWNGDIQSLIEDLSIRNARPNNFRITALDIERLTDMLYAFYVAEVRNRNAGVEDEEAVRTNCRNVAKFLSDRERWKFGLVLSGAVGCGKTTMVYAMKEMIAWLTESGKLSRCLVVRDAKEVAGEYDTLKDKPLLAVDDIGRESAESMKYGNVFSPVADLLEYRYAKRLFTVLTTNLPTPRIGEIYGARVYDRCREMFDVLTFKGKSYRG